LQSSAKQVGSLALTSAILVRQQRYPGRFNIAPVHARTQHGQGAQINHLIKLGVEKLLIIAQQGWRTLRNISVSHAESGVLEEKFVCLHSSVHADCWGFAGATAYSFKPKQSLRTCSCACACLQDYLHATIKNKLLLPS
jgi:hypothetical protein